jgi:CheY-like chemotaxis protein
MTRSSQRYGQLSNRVILYVEDDDATAYLFQTALVTNGIAAHLYRVTDGETALRFLRRGGPYETAPRPDLVVLDLNLPGMGGLEILRQIRRDPELQALSAVVFSSSCRPADRDRSLAAGADAYFVKESNLDGFTDAVQAICNRIPSASLLRIA